jgi:hypothetical protein
MPVPPLNPAVIEEGKGQVQPAAPIVSDDVEFLAELKDLVALEYDANAAGGVTDAAGLRDEDWQLIVGLGSVPCHLTIRQPVNVKVGDRPSAQLTWLLQFGRSMTLDIRNRVVWLDPEDGSTRYGYVQGKLINAHGLNHHWTMTAIENPV